MTPAPGDQVRPSALRWGLSALAGLLLITLMAMTVIDVIGRYLLNAPLRGATELTELLLVATIFLGLPAVALSDDHVTVDLITDRLPAWIHPWRQALTGLFSAAILAVVAWRIYVYAAQIGGYGGSTTTLRIPLAPVGYFCATCTLIGAVLTLAVPLLRLIRGR